MAGGCTFTPRYRPMTHKLESDPLWVSLQADLLREVAHDLRGRAMAMRGFAELQDLAGLGGGGEMLRLPLPEVERVESLARDLETVNGPVTEEAELISLDPEVRRAARALARLGEVWARQMEVEEVAGDPPAVRVPPTALRRLVMVATAGVGRGAGAKVGTSLRLRVEAGEGEVRVVVRGRASADFAEPERPEVLLTRTGARWRWIPGEGEAELQLAFSG